MSTSRERIEQFDGLRAIAFLAVFCRHMVHVWFGQLGVDMFFVLSGFLITRNLLVMRDSASAVTGAPFKVFFYRRLLRIIPPYYLALAVMLLVGFLPLGESPWYFGFVSNIRDSIYPVVGGPPVTLWSIAIEEQFYILWPFLVLLVPRRFLAPTLVAPILLAPLVRFAFRDNPDAVYRLMISRMDLLAYGAVLALIDVRRPEWLPSHRGKIALVGAVAFAAFVAITLTVAPTDHRVDVWHIGYSLSAIAFSCLLVVVRTDRAVLRRVLMFPPLAYIGKVSYTAYLIHVVMIELLLEVAMPGPVRIVAALAATIAFASASWYLLEQPLQRLKGRVK